MKLIQLLIVLVLLISCGGSNTIVDNTGEEDVWMPKWWGKTDANYFTGDAISESKDKQFALNKATSSAINKIAIQIEVKNTSLMKQFMDETGVGADSELIATATQVLKQTTSAVLKGLRTEEQKLRRNKVTNLYIAYVKVVLPKGELANDILNRMKAKKNLYSKFQASKAYKELDEEAKKMDEYKRKQGL